MTKQDELELKKLACRVRMNILTATHGAGAGHPGGSLSSTEAFTYLYFREMKVDPKHPKAQDRDRFVLSKGHSAPGLYAALALRGFFPEEDLPTLRHADSYLQGHPNMNTVPGVDMSTGSLGQGISTACGMALGGKAQGAGPAGLYFTGRRRAGRRGSVGSGDVCRPLQAGQSLCAGGL